MFKPLIPILSDFWDHEFNEIEHISIVHAKYGSHHLQKEVADTDTSNDNQKGQTSLKSNDEVSFHVLRDEYQFKFPSNNTDVKYGVFEPTKLRFVFIFNQGPPPKFSI
jgi:hypothetical protein